MWEKAIRREKQPEREKVQQAPRRHDVAPVVVVLVSMYRMIKIWWITMSRMMMNKTLWLLSGNWWWLTCHKWIQTFQTARRSEGAVARRRRRCEEGARPPDISLYILIFDDIYDVIEMAYQKKWNWSLINEETWTCLWHEICWVIWRLLLRKKVTCESPKWGWYLCCDLISSLFQIFWTLLVCKHWMFWSLLVCKHRMSPRPTKAPCPTQTGRGSHWWARLLQLP